jgi:alginate O-acetyltransferase complex protein AlgI
MLFNSLSFLFAFLPVTYFIFWRLKTKNQRYVWLTLSGYVFYAQWNYKFCALMAFSTLVSFAAGLGLGRWRDLRRRRLCLVLPVVLDLAVLGFFKYFNFGLASAAAVSRWVSHPIDIHPIDIILPIGISFYTFHTITYIVDCYRGVVQPTKNFFEFACYVCFFPQLVAGPIVRFRQVRGDLDALDQADRVSDLNRGWSFFAIGLMKKVLIADSIAAVIDPALAAYGGLSTLNAWLCLLGYSYQLYFDFSGYSDMAVGLGFMFGVRLPQNFNSPYQAVDIGDFWRRWHISLSTCLRDYLYIPLGGSRNGAAKTYRNLLITMLLGGLWHGANWTFVVWGAYHGILLVMLHAFSDEWNRLNVHIRRAATFLAVVIGWVFFRAQDFSMVTGLMSRLFSYHDGPALPATGGLVAIAAIAAAIAHGAPNTFQIKHDWRLASSGALAVGYVICLVIIAGGTPSPFLYFQF